MWIGIDGEGKGRDPHKYIMLAASEEHGGWSNRVYNPNGLSTRACLEFIARIPKKRAFSFSFNYDLTKMLWELDDMSLYYLLRPEHRQSQIEGAPPIPIHWNEFELNLQGTKFTVKQYDKKVIVWDLFRFFQCKFTKALVDWNVLSQNDIDQMESMKAKRGEFEKENDNAIFDYCMSECRAMAALARKLTAAHREAGLNLKNYFGAGSTGAAILDDMGVKQNIRQHIHYSYEKEPVNQLDMKWAVMSAFFGGRFENSVIGRVDRPIYSADLSSAYPYQLTQLPCLRHGKWELTKNIEDVIASKAALVNWQLGPSSRSDVLWGPFSFRTQEGTILFPIDGGTGWVYRDEFLAGRALFSNVRMRSAWVLKQDCICTPFPKMGHYYKERIRIGKTGAGIVFKLGPNSCYGKLAQSVGKPQYQSWLWAGMITSGCRAQILEGMRSVKNLNHILAIATDGIYSLSKPANIIPKDTGTFGTGKPLGGWEIEEIPQGMFFARPGINFPLGADMKEAKVRARGLGRKSVYENRQRILDTWNEFHAQQHPFGRFLGEFPKVEFPDIVRFIGAKSSIRRKLLADSVDEYIYSRDENYGEWTNRPVVMSFNPAPKRSGIIIDSRRDYHHLGVWHLAPEALSAPYKYRERPEEVEAIELLKLLSSEQPDWVSPLEN